MFVVTDVIVVVTIVIVIITVFVNVIVGVDAVFVIVIGTWSCITEFYGDESSLVASRDADDAANAPQ